jgi:hypothetical protein
MTKDHLRGTASPEAGRAGEHAGHRCGTARPGEARRAGAGDGGER